MLIFEALQAGSILKPDSALAPFAKQGQHIFGDKDNLCGPSDECVLFGVGFGCDQRKHGAAVGRGNRYPALAGPEADVSDQTEAKLVQIESQAFILTTYEDVNGVNAEMGLLRIQAKGRLVRVQGCRRDAHRRDYSVRRAILLWMYHGLRRPVWEAAEKPIPDRIYLSG